jgi:hypothetical protein
LWRRPAWTVSVGAALTGAGGLGIANLTNGAIPRSWGAVAHSLAGGGLVLAGGFRGFEKVMKALIATMFFAIVACAAFTFHDPAAALRGLLVPAIPSGDGSSVLSVLGGIGGSIAMLAYNYWLREEKMAFRPAPERVRLTTVASTPYRVTLLFITLVPIPFAFVDRPRAASRGTRHLPTQCWSLR